MATHKTVFVFDGGSYHPQTIEVEYRKDPLPYTGKKRRHNPEHRAWKGVSYRSGGRRVRDMRAELIQADFLD